VAAWAKKIDVAESWNFQPNSDR